MTLPDYFQHLRLFINFARVPNLNALPLQTLMKPLIVISCYIQAVWDTALQERPHNHILWNVTPCFNNPQTNFKTLQRFSFATHCDSTKTGWGYVWYRVRPLTTRHMIALTHLGTHLDYLNVHACSGGRAPHQIFLKCGNTVNSKWKLKY